MKTAMFITSSLLLFLSLSVHEFVAAYSTSNPSEKSKDVHQVNFFQERSRTAWQSMKEVWTKLSGKINFRTVKQESELVLKRVDRSYRERSRTAWENIKEAWKNRSGDINIRIPKQEPELVHEVHCSRERSRTAWNIIEEYLMPFMEKEKYQLSSKCRLHPDNDMFRDHEQHKIHTDVNEWQCGYCKKSFHAEKFLDQHLDSRHSDLLNASQSSCLADLCGALQCDLVMNTKSPKSKCNLATTARNRHLCESLAYSCFPIHKGLSACRLNEMFLQQFCDALSCSAKQKPFSSGGKKQTSVFYPSIVILTMMPASSFLYPR